MRAVVQRVSRAEVRVDNKTVGKIDRGFLILVGFTHDELSSDLEWTAKKIAGLRIFEDDEDKMNLSLRDIDGQVLVVSQFTLYADVRKGRRPSFVEAAHPEIAKKLYEEFCDYLAREGLKVVRGVFGAKMEVDLVNDGPVTIVVDRSRSSEN